MDIDMTDLEDIKADSQVLDGPAPTMETPAELPDDPAKVEGISAEDAVAKAFDAVSKDDEPEDKPEEPEKKAEKAEKPEKVEKVKPEPKVEAKAEDDEDQPDEGDKRAAPEKDDAGTGQDGEKKVRQSEGRPAIEPPARFLPRAKEVWANVPNAVKGEIARMTQEHEAEVAEHRAFREELREYEELAKQHNVTIKGTLDRYVAADRLLNQDFGRGVAQLFQMYGKNPAEALTSVMQAVGVTPQQFAEFITKNPQAAQPQPQPRADPAVQQTQTELQTLKQELEQIKLQQAAREIIEPFRASHPRYDELQDDIAFFLQSGKIPQTLSPAERLEAAYDMAERINPRSVSAGFEDDDDALEPETPVVDPRGKKSIKGAPNGINPERRRKMSQDDAIKAAFEQFGLT